MNFGGGTSWGNFLGFQSSSLFDQILESENTNLGTLLDDDRVLEELKRDNPKLIEFLNPDRVRELVELVTVYPPADADEKRGYKFPFMASELFACESSHLINAIFSESSIFEFLLNFLTYEPFNSTLAGYFSKLVISLIAKDAQKTLSTMQAFGCFNKLCENMKTKSISDIIIKILTLSSQEYQFCLEPRKILFSLVLDQFKVEDTMVSISLQSIFCEFIEKSIDINSWKSIFQIVIKEKSGLIFEAAQSGQPNRMLAALKFFKDFLKSSACDQFFDNSALSDDESSMEVDRDPELSEFSLNMLKCCDFLTSFLKTPPETFQSTSKSLVYKRLGQERLSIVEFFTQLLKIKFKEVEEKFKELQIIPTIIDLFFTYEHNSFLQIDVEHLVSYIFMHKGTDDCYIESLLQSSLFSHLAEEDLKKPYSGYLVRIFNNIEKTLKTHKLFEDKIRDLPEWEQFSKELEKVNEINTTKLAKNSEADGDGENSGVGNPGSYSSMNPPVLPTGNSGMMPMSTPPVLPIGVMQTGPPNFQVPFIPGSTNKIPGPPGIPGSIPGPPSIPGSFSGMHGPPIIPGGLPKLTGPPLLPGSMPNMHGPPLIPGSMPKLTGPPLIPGSMPNMHGPPLIPGSMPNMHGPPIIPGSIPGQPLLPGNMMKIHPPLSQGTPGNSPPTFQVHSKEEPESEESSNKPPEPEVHMEIVNEDPPASENKSAHNDSQSTPSLPNKILPSAENSNRSKTNSIDDNPQALSEYWHFG